MINGMFKLLLIEDDITLFQEMKERLIQWSYDVYGIADFSQVMNQFTAVKPDLVIVDTTIPFSSILYVNLLSCLLFILFFAFLFYKETTFYRQLQERDPLLDVSTLSEAARPFYVNSALLAVTC